MYYEGYRDTRSAGAGLEDLGSGERQVHDRSDEPIRIPAILNWLVIVTIALCVIITAIQALS